MNSLQIARVEKDHFFARHEQSPLTTVQKRNFSGLPYFPEDASLRLEVEIDIFQKLEVVNIQTTKGDLQAYQRYGRFKFTVEGETAQLTIFKSEHGYFLPFIDTLAGKETYPAGRYLEPEKLPGGKFLVDFNEAYNPYCAYNEQWSCPITPAENRLKVAIRAGERIFNH
jgi:uncharacterized protein